MAIAEKREAKEVKDEREEAISVVFKVNLHCQQCVLELQKPLTRTQGVQRVDFDLDNGKITVKGNVDPKKIHKQIEKSSKKKVEMISLVTANNNSNKVSEKKGEEKKESKEPVVSTTVIKVHMHCEKCERDLKKNILKFEGVHSVNTSSKAQTCSVDGMIDPHKLIEYLCKKVHRHAEIVALKHDIKEKEKREQVKELRREESKRSLKDKAKEVTEGKKDGFRSDESSVPYFSHYAYAPELFSDDNPNSCSVM